VTRRPARRWWLALLLVGLLPACGTGDLQLRADTRVRFVAPAQDSTVHLPMTVRWSVRDFTVLPASASASPAAAPRRDAGLFAVFVDRAPIRPGQSVSSLADGDKPCLRTPGCPNEAYLNSRHVYTTRTPELTIEGLADTRPVHRPSAKDRHEVIVVLLDSLQRRIGESFYRLDFVVDRTDQQLG
jgi:hypothetical protein